MTVPDAVGALEQVDAPGASEGIGVIKPDGAGMLVLLSGGMDSAALAAWARPQGCLFINYGQVPAHAELRAATAVADALNLDLDVLIVDLSPVGLGLLSDRAGPMQASPSPEWWPYRNQLLASLAAAWCVTHNEEQSPWTRLALTSVRGDRERHVDGSPDFYARLDGLVAIQEGHLRVLAPAVDLDATELLTMSGISDDVLAWTHSCHLANTACGRCPGCHKRADVLAATGRLQ